MKLRFPLKTLHLYVTLSLAVFILVQILKTISISEPIWVFHYLNDFLTIPIVATVCLHVIWFLKKDKTIRLNIFTIICLVLLYSIFFEYYLPKQSDRYTADIWDVLCYSSGGFVFHFLQQKK